MTRGLASVVTAYSCAIALTILTVSALGASAFRDPRGLEATTTAHPYQYWQPAEPSPEMAIPVVPQDLLGEFSGQLSLAQLSDLALRLNPRTREAWAFARAEAAGVGVEQADELPQIAGIYSFARSQSASQTSGARVPPQNRYGPGLSLSYVLYDFGARANEVEAARYRLLAANLTQNRTLQEVVFQVEQAYYRLFGFEALVKANRESLKNFETSLDATNKRRESGLATIGDVYRAETAVGQARLTLRRSEGELSKSHGLLNNAVGLPVSYELKLQPLAGAPPFHEVSDSMETLLQKAKANRPDLAAAEAKARAARASAQAAAVSGFPSLEVTGTLGRVEFTDERASVNTFNVGLNLRIPIFTGFRDTYNVRRAEALAEQAEGARDQLLRETELDVWQAYFDLQTAVASIASTDSLVKSATESATAALARYNGGIGSLLDLITAQADETNARVQRIQSYLDWYAALARFNFALGASESALQFGKQE